MEIEKHSSEMGEWEKPFQDPVNEKNEERFTRKAKFSSHKNNKIYPKSSHANTNILSYFFMVHKIENRYFLAHHKIVNGRNPQ